MLQAPGKYLSSILSNAAIEKDISLLIQYFVSKNNKNLHFIIDENELDIKSILTSHCHILARAGAFDFRTGRRVAQLSNSKIIFSKSALAVILFTV